MAASAKQDSRGLPLCQFNSTSAVPFFILLAIGSTAIVYSQSSGCPNLRLGPTFKEGATYFLDVNVPNRGTTLDTQARHALNQWNSANIENGTYITFDTVTPIEQVPGNANVIHVQMT